MKKLDTVIATFAAFPSSYFSGTAAHSTNKLRIPVKQNLKKPDHRVHGMIWK
jgi:hypothetical protein